MPEVTVQIDGRDIDLVCQPGEEQQLQAAAARLEGELTQLRAAAADLPESRRFLLAGLMLADQLVQNQREEELQKASHAAQAQELAALKKSNEEFQQGLFAQAAQDKQAEVKLQETLTMIEEMVSAAEKLAKG